MRFNLPAVKYNRQIRINDYDYPLPEEKIAKFPLVERDHSKLLLYRKNQPVTEDKFYHLEKHLSERSLLVFNNSKVIQARIPFYKSTGAKIEIFCLNPVDPPEFSSAFQQQNRIVWKCLIGNLKKWKVDNLEKKIPVDNSHLKLIAHKKEKIDESAYLIEFTWNGDLTFGEILDISGIIPIPPYLNRESEAIDTVRYQTIYSKWKGSVAAPTAGLHFTGPVFQSLAAKNIETLELTLHVGAGTFKPVKEKNALDHRMHAELFTVSAMEIEKITENHNNIIAVGTTSLRTLESIYWLGVKSTVQKHEFNPDYLGQWEYEDLPQNISVKNALESLLNFMKKSNTDVLISHTQIMIVPGYTFRVIKGLITNFHQPKSTLLLLISSLVGDDWKKIYDYALKHDFRFLSYGDSSLLLP